MLIQNSKVLKGQSLVEFALTIPVLLLMVLGTFEFARLFLAWVTVQNCAQSAARFATTGKQFADPHLDPWDTARLGAIKAQALDKAVSLNIDGTASPSSSGYFHVFVYASDPPVLGAEYPGGPNARVAVDVVYNYPLIMPLLNVLFPYITLTGHSEMINEQFRHPGYGTPMGALPATIVPTPTPSHTPTSTGIPTVPATYTATSPAPSSTASPSSTHTSAPTSTMAATHTNVPTSTRTYTPTPTTCPDD
jgi:Flp pilus assembly protein TadG